MTGSTPHSDLATAGAAAIFDERMRLMRELLERSGFLPLAERRVLDIGCGHGHDLARLRQWGARAENLTGIEPQPERARVARETYPDFRFICAGAQSIDLPDSSMDLVLMCTVMSSVLDEGVARSIAAEVRRVLRPGGAVLWYDFRYISPTNRRTRPMTSRHLDRYFPDFEGERRTLSVLPPLMRRLGRSTAVLYPLLARVPLLRTHRMALLRKPAGSAAP